MEVKRNEFQVQELTKWASEATNIIRKDRTVESLDESDMSGAARAEKAIVLSKINACAPVPP
jgi:hypothetical protein